MKNSEQHHLRFAMASHTEWQPTHLLRSSSKLLAWSFQDSINNTILYCSIGTEIFISVEIELHLQAEVLALRVQVQYVIFCQGTNSKLSVTFTRFNS